MTKETMRIAILGCAHVHVAGVAAYAPKTGMKVSHVWDHDATRATGVARAHGAQVAEGHGQILADPGISAVMIFAETAHHDALIEACIDAGKHVYVDKPLCLSAQGAHRLARRLNESGLLFSTGYVLRRRAQHILLRRMIHEGTFGRITRIRYANSNKTALTRDFDAQGLRWFTDPALSGGGGFLDEGTHSADILLWLLGTRALKAIAHVEAPMGAYPGVDEAGVGLIRFENGVIGQISGAWIEPAKAVTLEVVGTAGSAWVAADRDLYLNVPGLAGADGKTPWTQLPDGTPHPQENFLNALHTGDRSLLATPSEAAAGAALMAALYQSLKTQAWMDVPIQEEPAKTP